MLSQVFVYFQLHNGRGNKLRGPKTGTDSKRKNPITVNNGIHRSWQLFLTLRKQESMTGVTKSIFNIYCFIGSE